jgi:cob(I)alamin adenosyltransferase
VARSFLRRGPVDRVLEAIQNELFHVGAELASERPVRTTKRRAAAFRLDGASVRRLEALIDEYDAKVPPLRTFILPAGTTAAATMHLARTVCRRAERAVITLDRNEGVNPAIIAYLNRLCDLLFALARYLNKSARRPELTWRKDT